MCTWYSLHSSLNYFEFTLHRKYFKQLIIYSHTLSQTPLYLATNPKKKKRKRNFRGGEKKSFLLGLAFLGFSDLSASCSTPVRSPETRRSVCLESKASRVVNTLRHPPYATSPFASLHALWIDPCRCESHLTESLWLCCLRAGVRIEVCVLLIFRHCDVLKPIYETAIGVRFVAATPSLQLHSYYCIVDCLSVTAWQRVFYSSCWNFVWCRCELRRTWGVLWEATFKRHIKIFKRASKT